MSAKNIASEKTPGDLGMSGPSSSAGKARPDKSPVMDLEPEVTKPMSGKLTPGHAVGRKYAPGGGSVRKK